MFFFAYRRYVSQAAKWPATSGKISVSTIERFVKREEGKDRTYYAPVVEYVFQVYGHEYRSRQIKLGIEMTGSQIFAEAIAAKYP
jgi:hypothetical protein